MIDCVCERPAVAIIEVHTNHGAGSTLTCLECLPDAYAASQLLDPNPKLKFHPYPAVLSIDDTAYLQLKEAMRLWAPKP